MKRHRAREASGSDGEFLWLVSLSDLMILLFVFMTVLYSFSSRKMQARDYEAIATAIRGTPAAARPLDEIQRQLLHWAKEKNLLSAIQVGQDEDALVIQIREKLLFEPGQYSLKSGSIELVSAISEALGHIPAPYRVGVEGHTDDSPVQGSARGYLDNWELSSQRALSVLRGLNLNPATLQRSVVMGYGSSRPLLPNRDAQDRPIPGNQALNRRVTLRIY